MEVREQYITRQAGSRLDCLFPPVQREGVTRIAPPARSCLFEADPFIIQRRLIFEQANDQRLGVAVRDDHSTMRWLQKLLRDRVIEEVQKVVVIAFNVQDSARLPLQAKLGPGQDLAEFLKRAEPTWQCDERVGQLRHESLSLMHGADHPQIREPPLCHSLFDQRSWNNANNVSPCLKCRIRQRSHQPNITATVNNGDLVRDEVRCQRSCCSHVTMTGPWTRSDRKSTRLNSSHR